MLYRYVQQNDLINTGLKRKSKTYVNFLPEFKIFSVVHVKGTFMTILFQNVTDSVIVVGRIYSLHPMVGLLLDLTIIITV
jgi:hypothetical protein